MLTVPYAGSGGKERASVYEDAAGNTHWPVGERTIGDGDEEGDT